MLESVDFDRADFEEKLRRILDQEADGVIAIFTKGEDYSDYSVGTTITEFRDALLDLARDLAAYQGE